MDEHKELSGKMIFLGFESDPFPYGHDCSPTIKMIKLLKSYGCHIMFCTKGIVPTEVFNLLDESDSVGITITCGDDMCKIYEPNSVLTSSRLKNLEIANRKGMETWISIEPVLEPDYIYKLLNSDAMKYVSKVKLGKLNHMEISDLTGNKEDYIDWTTYGKKSNFYM